MPRRTQELVTLSLTDDQLEAIEVFFAHNGWPVEILEQKEIVLPLPESLRSRPRSKSRVNLEVNVDVKAASRESTPVLSDNDEDLGTTKILAMLDVSKLTYEDFQVDDDACAQCFWFPCVTNNKPVWLGQGCPPKDGNTMLRKDSSYRIAKKCHEVKYHDDQIGSPAFAWLRYLKYIKFLREVGCWRHPAYVLRKRAALEDRANRTEDMVWAGNKHVRELIPACVVDMVRRMYPNPVGKGYDGEAPFFKTQEKNTKV